MNDEGQLEKYVHGGLIRTKFDMIKRGIANGLKPSKICLADILPKHGIGCWIANWKTWRTWTNMEALGINVFDRDYCIGHR